MLAKFNKAWVAGVVSFIGVQLNHWFGFELGPDAQAAIVGVVATFLTWLIPNKP